MAGLFNRLQDELEARRQPGGLSPVDLLDLPPDLAAAIREIIRKNGMPLPDIAEALSQSAPETQQALDTLEQKGFVRRIEVKGVTWYKAHFARKADKSAGRGFWAALDGLSGQDEQSEI